MLVRLLIAMLVCIDAIISINHFSFHKGSIESYLIWQILIVTAIVMIIIFRKNISEIKPE